MVLINFLQKYIFSIKIQPYTLIFNFKQAVKVKCSVV